MQEAAARATKMIVEARERSSFRTFKDKGLTVTEVDKADFEKTVMEKGRRSRTSATTRPTGKQSARSSSRLRVPTFAALGAAAGEILHGRS